MIRYLLVMAMIILTPPKGSGGMPLAPKPAVIEARKHIKMENKEQDFINRYKNVQESIVKAMDKALERAIGNKAIDFEKCEGNYLDIYPLIGAVLQKELRSVLGENVNKSISRNMKIKATKYRNDYRVWLDYAGDYRNENIE